MSISPYPSVLQQRDLLSQGQSTSLQMTEISLERASQGEGPRVFTRVFRVAALAQAQSADALRTCGLQRSVLDGLPVSVKDLFDIQGYATTAGSRLLANGPVARSTAVVVQRLQAAGAVIVGTTNMTEFAYSGLGLNPHYGTPQNPWERGVAGGRIPGGSSSGAAVSVTDGMAVAAIGSDTGGSVRIPSAFCGLTGFKPSASRVSMEGVLPLSRHLDSIGPLAPTVACCAALDAIISGDNTALPEAMNLYGLRLLAPRNVVLEGMDALVAANYERALSLLVQAGALVDTADVPEFAELPAINAKGGFTAAEAWAWHRQYLPEQLAQYDARVGSRIQRGRDMLAADFIDLLQQRQRWIARVEARCAPYDLMLMPTVPIVAPLIDGLVASDEHYFSTNGLVLRNCTLINFLDGCAISLPCHRSGEAPVGLMLAAPHGQDRRLLAAALAVETLLRNAD